MNDNCYICTYVEMRSAIAYFEHAKFITHKEAERLRICVQEAQDKAQTEYNSRNGVWRPVDEEAPPTA